MIIKLLFSEHLSRWSILIDIIFLFIAFNITKLLVNVPEIVFEIDQIFLFVTIPIFILVLTKSYSFFLRYTSLTDVIKILLSLIFANGIIFLFVEKSLLSFNFVLLNFFNSISFLISYRFFIKYLNRRVIVNNIDHNVLIFGCGKSGILTKRALFNNPDYNILGFVDDDKTKLNMNIDGVKVYGINDRFENFLTKNNIHKVFITTKKISSLRLKYLYDYFGKYNIQILQIPAVGKWINGLPKVSDFKEIKIEDLLGRSEIKIDIKKNQRLYKDKELLVTGAAGSIGSEIVRQLIKFKPKKIILLDCAETPLFLIREELLKLKTKTNFIFYVKSVTDNKFIKEVFYQNNIDIVFHAAAYKHVNMMEMNPKSAVYNNIYGTKVLVDASIEFNVNKFLLISTDKAVNPSNVMGASKRICELYLSSKIKDSNNTSLISTRFGNVLGSNGSVVPIFNKQIKLGGPVKITHPEIVRYFMTISEATQLVLEAAAISKGGEVYIFDMGKPVKIIDLAKNMIIQSGFKPYSEIDIEIIGLRPGEKLYEEILVDSENLERTHNKLIYIASKEIVDSKICNLIEKLINLSIENQENPIKIVKVMKEIVPEFKSNNSKFQVLDHA